MWNRAFLKELLVRDGKIVRVQHEEPFASLLGSHKGSLGSWREGCVNRLSLLTNLRSIQPTAASSVRRGDNKMP